VPEKYKTRKYLGRKTLFWLDKPLRKGQTVYLYRGPAYGSCKEGDYTLKPNQPPFFEIPSKYLIPA
jgi:hypothetical protein